MTKVWPPLNFNRGQDILNRRQPAFDGARRQSRLAVRYPHHFAVEQRLALGGDEPEHVGDSYVFGLHVDLGEEHSKVRGRCQQCVSPSSRFYELEISIDDGMTQAGRRISSDARPER